MDRKATLNLALERTQHSEDFRAFAKNLLREQSKGRTIFSKTAAVLKAALSDSLDDCREMLRKIECLKSGNDERFQGVKVKQLQRLVGLLFGEGKWLLSPQVFDEFDRSRLLGYLEICKRCFWVVQMERPEDRQQQVKLKATEKRESAMSDLLTQWQTKQEEDT